MKLVQCVSAMHEQWRDQKAARHKLPVGTKCTAGNDRSDSAGAATMEAEARPKLQKLVSCLLLIAIELLRGHSYSAYALIENSRRLLQAPTRPYMESVSEQEIMSRELVPIVARYEERIQDGLGVQVTGETKLPYGISGDLCLVVGLYLVNPNRLPRDVTT